MTNITEIAQRIYEELGSPSSPVVGFIQSILRFRVGDLNNLIDTEYTIDESSGNITPDMSEYEASILTAIYFLHYYDEKIRNGLARTDNDATIEVSENGATVRRVSPTEVIRYWSMQRKDHKLHLDDLVHKYRLNRASPLSVDGDDTTEGFYSIDDSRNE